MNTSDKLRKTYHTIYDILVSRGCLRENIADSLSKSDINSKIDTFLNTKDSSYIDITVDNEFTTFVKFFLPDESINKRKLDKIYHEISNYIGYNYQNEIIYILLSDSLTDTNINDIILLENTYSNLRILHYKNVMYNITKHYLVPKHTKFLGNVDQLLDELQLSSIDQLPHIDHQDPISKILNFRQDDVIEIARPTQSSKYQLVYRVVKSSEDVLELDLENQTEIHEVVTPKYSLSSITNLIRTKYRNDINLVPEEVIKEWLTYLNVDFNGLNRIEDLKHLLFSHFSDIFESLNLDDKVPDKTVLLTESKQESFSNPNVLLDEKQQDDKISDVSSSPVTESFDTASEILYDTSTLDKDNISSNVESSTQSPNNKTIYVEKVDEFGKLFYQNVNTGEIATEEIYKCEHEDKGCLFMGTYNQVLSHELVCPYIKK